MGHYEPYMLECGLAKSVGISIFFVLIQLRYILGKTRNGP